MIDSGWPGNEGRILEEIAAIGKPLRLILLTHSHIDHFGCAGEVKERTGCGVAIHGDDEKYLRAGETPIPETDFFGFWGKLFLPVAEFFFPPKGFVADRILRDGESFDFEGHEIRIIHTPGHTPGSCCILIGESLFVGDLLSIQGGLVKQSRYAFDWKAIDESVRKLLPFAFERIYPGHGERIGARDGFLAVIQRMDPAPATRAAP